jgi:hypothetical protein
MQGSRAELQEPVALMLREKIKRPKPQDERTDAEHWGGLIRSSDEGPVMGLERRGQVRWSWASKQLVTGGSRCLR